MSGARGIYRRLRVVEHGCCGRGENLVSVQFVKRSEGDNERSEDSRHKPRSEADSRVCAVSFLRSSIFLWGFEKTRRRLSPISRTYHTSRSTAQRTSRPNMHQKRYGCTDTLHMSLNDTHATTCRVRIVVNVYARDQMRAPCGAGRAASPTARWSQQGRAWVQDRRRAVRRAPYSYSSSSPRTSARASRYGRLGVR